MGGVSKEKPIKNGWERYFVKKQHIWIFRQGFVLNILSSQELQQRKEEESLGLGLPVHNPDMIINLRETLPKNGNLCCNGQETSNIRDFGETVFDSTEPDVRQLVEDNFEESVVVSLFLCCSRIKLISFSIVSQLRI